MKKLSLVCLVAGAMMVSSCLQNGDGHDSYIPYVGTVLSDTSSTGYHVLQAQEAWDKYKAITITGDPTEILPIINEMLVADHFNNIDGRHVPDGLPDFSGEMIEALLDETNASYEGYIARDNSRFLREIEVRNFLSALDTNYLYSPYDRSQKEKRAGSKMVIFGSASSYLYGLHDVDTLCAMAQLEMPLFSSVGCMFDQVEKKVPEAQNLCIWTTVDKVENDLYPQSYEKYKQEKGIVGGKNLHVFHPDIYVPVETRFLDILDMYISSEMDEKIPVMIVDDPEVDILTLEKFVASVRSSTDESQLAYKNILAEDFELVVPARAIAETAYRYLRKQNGFTHKIAYPEFGGYITLPVNDLSVVNYRDEGGYTDEFKYFRADGEAEDTWFVIAMRKRYVSDEMKSKIERLAPKIEI